MRLGSPEWRAAREAVARFKETNDYRSERLQRLQQLLHRATNGSPADRVRLQQAVQYWSEFLLAGERNHATLLAELVAAQD